MLRSELGAQLNLTIDHIAAGRPNRPGRPLKPKFITVHNTANTNKGADAAAHARFLKQTGHYLLAGRKNWVSWHYTVDDRACVRHLPLNETGLHAGSAAGNSTSIGIEICMHEGIDQAAAFDRAAKLISCLCFDLKLDPAAAVRAHMHWSGKRCPALLLDDGRLGRRWQDFVDRIGDLVAALTAAARSPLAPD